MARLHFFPPDDANAMTLAMLDMMEHPSGPKIGLTMKQLEALDFIRRYIATHVVAPSFDEIAAHLGLKSKSGVHRLVTALVERGHLRRLRHRARALALAHGGA